ncbi:MAG: DUF488 domain-containing protein [Bellilinea sp.]
MAIRIKRAYEPPYPEDGTRILVDRVWPRGVTRERLQIQSWMKEIAPSTPLRQEFCHDPAKWDAFVESYFAELDEKPDLVSQLLEIASRGTLTLVYGARDQTYNQAAALKQYLESK